MKIFCFDEGMGRAIDSYGSENVILSRIARLEIRAHVGCMHIGPGGKVGYHRATTPQLFLVVHGEGWVRGGTAERNKIRAGQAAYWEKEEWHESGSDTGMMAIVIEMETEEFDPSEFMGEVRTS